MTDFTGHSTSSLLLLLALPIDRDHLALVSAEIDRRIPIPLRAAPYNPFYPRWTDPNASAADIRASIIADAGMMAGHRSPEMQAAYDRALTREGKVDSPDGPVYPADHPSAGERLTPEQAVALARNVIQKYSSSSDKPSVQLAIRVINGAHERDKLRDALNEALGAWDTWAVDSLGDDHSFKTRITELRKLLEKP